MHKVCRSFASASGKGRRIWIDTMTRMADPANENSALAPCPRCGALVRDGVEGCFALFYEMSGHEYSDPAYGAVNLLSVDAHALQHPEDHGVKNNAFHLIRLCWLLEDNGDPRIGQGPGWLQQEFDGNAEVQALEPPLNRGGMTIAQVVGATSPEEHTERVYRWARSVWKAWSAHHEWAREWLRRKRLDA